MYQYHRTAMKQWSRGAALALLLVCAGCSEGAKLVQESDSGGVVTYPFKGENGYLFSRFRTEALDMIEKRCKGAYSIVREGEAKGRSRVADNTGGPEVIAEHRWGLQFRCK
ncbi:MAG: hypothetical protein AAB093_07670 [Nitrospirota bacterium]